MKFFSHFLGLSHPGLERNNAGMMFFNFLNFFAIFLEFSCPGCVGMEFGTKIFFHFLGISHLGLKSNSVGMMFFNLLNFFGIFLAGSSRNRIRD